MLATAPCGPQKTPQEFPIKETTNTEGSCVDDSWESFHCGGLKPGKHLSAATIGTLPQTATRFSPTAESLHMTMADPRLGSLE